MHSLLPVFCDVHWNTWLSAISLGGGRGEGGGERWGRGEVGRGVRGGGGGKENGTINIGSYSRCSSSNFNALLTKLSRQIYYNYTSINQSTSLY